MERIESMNAEILKVGPIHGGDSKNGGDGKGVLDLVSHLVFQGEGVQGPDVSHDVPTRAAGAADQLLEVIQSCTNRVSMS